MSKLSREHRLKNKPHDIFIDEHIDRKKRNLVPSELFLLCTAGYCRYICVFYHAIGVLYNISSEKCSMSCFELFVLLFCCEFSVRAHTALLLALNQTSEQELPSLLQRFRGSSSTIIFSTTSSASSIVIPVIHSFFLHLCGLQG